MFCNLSLYSFVLLVKGQYPIFAVSVDTFWLTLDASHFYHGLDLRRNCTHGC